MKDFGMGLDQVFKLGFYEAHRLWLISDEIRFRDLQYQSHVLDYVHSEQDKRQEFLDWIHSKQPRRFGPKEAIPKEVLEKFAEAFR